MASLNFKPKQVIKRLVAPLSERGRLVIEKRYGILGAPERMTLEAIGATYGITRERIRQIENAALQSIRKSDHFAAEAVAFSELESAVESLGTIVAENALLEYAAKDTRTQNHIHFLLVLGDSFVKEKEDATFVHRWHTNPAVAKNVHQALKKLEAELSPDVLVQEEAFLNSFSHFLSSIPEKYRTKETLLRWLALSKNIDKNPLGEWGMARSPNIRAKGMRDYAYLAIRRHGSPMHFTEVAKAITMLFGKKAHIATCHNELIKDKRFGLVGRGLYALAEWGYAGGVVRDVIEEILKKHGPLTKRAIIEKVLKERYVKENTVAVNLENTQRFKKGKDGRYSLA